MEKIDKVLDLVMRFLMAVAMFALLCGGTWQIVSRWILGDPSTFTDEFLRYVLIWSSLLGSAYCFYKNKHLSLDLISARVTGKAKLIVTIIIEVAVLFFVGYVFIFGGIRLVGNATNVSAVIRIPFKILYAILPISGIFIYVARILNYIALLQNKDKKEGGAN